MKKSLIILAAAASLTACKKVPEGGNKGVIKMEEGQEHYTDDQRHGAATAGHGDAHGKAQHVEVEVKGAKLKAFAGGLEESMVKFLNTGAYEKDTDDALKSNWYSFDQVNFKMGSATELLSGSKEQLINLVQILKAYPTVKIKIGGYTDKTGDEAANKKLSQERADFIKSQLTAMGVGGQILGAEGYGSEFAKVPADKSDAERAVDRKMAVRFAK